MSNESYVSTASLIVSVIESFTSSSDVESSVVISASKLAVALSVDLLFLLEVDVSLNEVTFMIFKLPLALSTNQKKLL